jgi:MerR HTH family regulatory protein
VVSREIRVPPGLIFARHESPVPCRDLRLDVVRYTEYAVNGKTVELCTVGELAKALNRASVTIRAWERTGIMPPSGYRHPSLNPRGRRRLYSRAQIEGVVRIAEEEGVLVPGPRVTITDTKFTEKVHMLFVDLHRAGGRR